VAAESDPNVDVDGTLHTIDRWAQDLQSRLSPDMNNLQKLARLRSFLFDDLGSAATGRITTIRAILSYTK
jgi:regulator of sirC expression with transglutaminase-like and TPR domain